MNAGSIDFNNNRPAIFFGGTYFNLTVPVPVSTYPISISVVANTSGNSTNGAFVKYGGIIHGSAGIGIGVGSSNGTFDNGGTSIIGLKEWSIWCPSSPSANYPVSPFTLVAIHQNAAGFKYFHGLYELHELSLEQL